MKKYIKYIPFFVLLIYVLLISFIPPAIDGDAITFTNIKGDLISIILDRYHTWTSRIIIEGVLIAILQNIPWIWKICNTLIFLLLYYSFKKILNQKNDFFINCIIVILIMLYSYTDMSSAGWSPTTINYLWPLALGMFCIIPVSNILKDKKNSYLMYFLTIPCLIFATNQEQCACILTGFMLLFLLYYYIKTKKISYVILCYFIISLLSIIFCLTTAGNYNRFQLEIARWFADYNQLNLENKLILSTINTFEIFLGKINYIWITFYGCICYFLYKNKASKLLLICGNILLVGTIILPISNLFSLNELYNTYHTEFIPILPYLKINSIAYYLSFVICIIYTIITSIILFYLQYKNFPMLTRTHNVLCLVAQSCLTL